MGLIRQLYVVTLLVWCFLGRIEADTSKTSTESENYVTVLETADSRYATPAASLVRPIRIMPIGDSITEGPPPFGSYRKPLAEKLREAGVAFEYIGRRGSESGYHHEGYSGKNAGFIAETVVSSFSEFQPDILLIHAGHNYDASEKPVLQISAAIEHIIQTFRQTNPRATVLLAQVIPSGKLPKYSYIPELNEHLARLAHRMDAPEQRVVLVDQASGFNTESDTVADKVHPNHTGAEKMANCWFAALRPLLIPNRPTF